MLVVMKAHAPQNEIDGVCARIRELGFIPHPMPGASRTAIGVTGNPGPLDPELFEGFPGVAQAIPVTKPYKLVSRDMRDSNTCFTVPLDGGTAAIGGKRLAVIAGPCAVETLEQTVEAAKAVKAAGASFLRGGAYKPRTSPYAFQGLGKKGLEILAEARKVTGLPVATEAVDVETVDAVEEYADIIQIGARQMQSFSLLRRVGESRKPVLLKRGMCATLDEFLQAAEYIMAGGNYNVILCERGVRTFSDHNRNTLDLSAVPVLKRRTHLPVIVDPSHATGSRLDVGPMALAAVASGADGLMIEVHPHPEQALSDGPQALVPADFAALMQKLRLVAAAVGREI